MNTLYEIGNDSSLLRVTKTNKGLSVVCGVETMAWGEKGKATLKETLKDQEQQIYRKLKTLDKTNRSSKKGLEFLLKEITENKQLELFKIQ